MKLSLRLAFACTILVVLLTYSRGGLLGLAVVLMTISLKRKRNPRRYGPGPRALLGLEFCSRFLEARMGHFSKGNLDARQNSAWFHGEQPGTCSGLPNYRGLFRRSPHVDVFQSYQPRPCPLGLSFERPAQHLFSTSRRSGVRRSWIVPIADRILFLGVCRTSAAVLASFPPRTISSSTRI